MCFARVELSWVFVHTPSLPERLRVRLFGSCRIFAGAMLAPPEDFYRTAPSEPSIVHLVEVPYVSAHDRGKLPVCAEGVPSVDRQPGPMRGGLYRPTSRGCQG